MSTLKNILRVISTGYILVYFSEHLFWAQIRPEDSLKNWIMAWLAYSLMAYIFLFVVSYFRVRNIWALFLAGSVFGWLAEGVVVQTTYESLPLSISFTGLAWHALITVGVGWYAVRRVLRTDSIRPVLRLAGLIGLVYGLWAICWWLEPDGRMVTVADFSLFNFTITILVNIAYWLEDWSSSEPMHWNKWVTGLIAACFLLYFIFVAVPAAPLAVVILPVLLGLAALGLFRNRQQEDSGSLLDPTPFRTPTRQYLMLLALPITAVLVYAAAFSFEIRIQTNWILYLITTPLGFFAFGFSLYKLLRRTRQNP